MAGWKVVRPHDLASRPGVAGSTERILIGHESGAMHFEIALVEIDGESEIGGHVHPYEESFYVVDGEGVLTVGAASYQLSADDFALVALGQPHAWSNRTVEPLRLLRVRAPQPRPGTDSHHPSHQVTAHPGGAVPPREVAAPWRPVGRFDSGQLPKPGPLAMKGYRGPRISGVSLWMLIDELVGALHHTMFVVEFAPGGDRQSAGDHYHPFDEAYYFVAGSAIAHLDGEDVPVQTGDLVFCGVNALHGYTVTGDVPVRWIEVQAPVPPPSGATFFPADWQTDADGLAGGG